MAFSLFRRNTESPYMHHLREFPLFKDLTRQEMAIVHGLLHERNFLADEVIFDAGEEGQAIYIVVDGSVLICRQGHADDGVIATLEPGQCFGELALLTNGPRLAQARAQTACTMLVFFRDDFSNLLKTHVMIASKLSLCLARHASERLRAAVQGMAVDHSI